MQSREASRMLVDSWLEGVRSPENLADENATTLDLGDLTSDEAKFLALDLTGHLSQRQHCVIHLHWGVTTGSPVPHDKIAVLMGLTVAEVDEIYYQGLVSLKRMAKGISSKLDEELLKVRPSGPHVLH